MKTRVPEQKKLKKNGRIPKGSEFHPYEYDEFLEWKSIADPDDNLFEDYMSYLDEECADGRGLLHGWLKSAG